MNGYVHAWYIIFVFLQIDILSFWSYSFPSTTWSFFFSAVILRDN